MLHGTLGPRGERHRNGHGSQSRGRRQPALPESCAASCSRPCGSATPSRRDGDAVRVALRAARTMAPRETNGATRTRSSCRGGARSSSRSKGGRSSPTGAGRRSCGPVRRIASGTRYREGMPAPSSVSSRRRRGALLDELSQGHFLARSMALDGRGYWLHQKAIRALRDPAASSRSSSRSWRSTSFERRGVRPDARPAGRIAEEHAQRVQEFIAARYREPLTLAQVARAVDASPFHLSRLVKAATGLPIHRMIVRLRLRDALEQLLETRESIAFIALATGFASHSHLTDAFTREYGMPPSAVRARRPRRGCPRVRP